MARTLMLSSITNLCEFPLIFTYDDKPVWQRTATPRSSINFTPPRQLTFPWGVQNDNDMRNSFCLLGHTLNTNIGYVYFFFQKSDSLWLSTDGKFESAKNVCTPKGNRLAMFAYHDHAEFVEV
ncbi:hypothetical protein [Streptomyces sp. NPDC057418]|uniref:hypothetical protein n=1 Tax=Streptomyces sp. NPDC057418 TaxID=3346126 RepID=UPI00367C7D93